MRRLRNVMFVLFFVVAAATSGLSASNAAQQFAGNFNCDGPTYWTTGGCLEGAVTMYCQIGWEQLDDFCMEAEAMCSAHCAQYDAEGALNACYANIELSALDCQCMATCN